MTSDWFVVDREGLARVLERRGKASLATELIQNAFDAPGTKNASMSMRRIPGTRRVELIVSDDSPDGFLDLSTAWRLFSPSVKSGNAELRGRFSMGEKQVLSMATSAEVTSTTGSVVFGKEGRRRTKKKTEMGTIFKCEIPMSVDEQEAVLEVARSIIPPNGVHTTINGDALPTRTPLATFTATLTTEIGDAEGVLRRSKRKTKIEVYESWTAEPTLYEMGLPVTASGATWSINVLQRIPMGLERDSVPPTYLVQLHALVVEQMRERLTQEDATSPWLREAMSRHADDISNEAITRIVDLRFGERRVAYDVRDREANSLAVATGHQVVHGSQMSQGEWQAVKRAGAILPAGRVTPSPRPFSADGTPLKMLDRTQWSADISETVAYIEHVSSELVDTKVVVEVTSKASWPFAAVYAPGRMILNLGRLGHKWFDRAAEGYLERMNRLVIHELGHHEGGGDHLSQRYHDALTDIGARMTQLALNKPSLFR